MTPAGAETCALTCEQDIVRARQIVRRAAQNARFSIVEQTKIVTAASELARNTVIHGKGGTMELTMLSEPVRVGIRLCFVDQGAGIDNLELAMQDGWSSQNGLGLGLSGARRLSSEFHIESTPGEGTRVTMTRWTALVRT